jgi:ABC-2 type transport system permease protein
LIKQPLKYILWIYSISLIYFEKNVNPHTAPMNKTLLIIQHEYLKRVKKKSFIIMTLLTPLLMMSIYLIPLWLAMQKNELKTVQVLDETGLFKNKLKDNEEVKFLFISGNLEKAKAEYPKSKTSAMVYIPANIVDMPSKLQIFSEKGVNFSLKNSIEKIVEEEVKNTRLERAGINLKVLENNKVNVSASTYNLNADGEKKSSSEAAAVVGYILAFLLYGILFIYGAQVMRGVMEEKTNRIVEVIISSVKPFQLLMGKIIGIGMVGVTQFVLWIGLSYALIAGTSAFLLKDKVLALQTKVAQANKKLNEDQPIQGQKPDVPAFEKVLDTASTLPLAKIAFTFILYFIGGYLLYSSLFAAVGAAVDNEADTQQFMLPITLPIIVAIILATATMKDPDSNLAFWASMIPFTSPINMLARIPYGVPNWQIALSLLLLLLGFLGTTWLAARIYRVGILMYGKKVNFKELGKWLFYKG